MPTQEKGASVKRPKVRKIPTRKTVSRQKESDSCKPKSMNKLKKGRISVRKTSLARSECESASLKKHKKSKNEKKSTSLSSQTECDSAQLKLPEATHNSENSDDNFMTKTHQRMTIHSEVITLPGRENYTEKNKRDILKDLVNFHVSKRAPMPRPRGGPLSAIRGVRPRLPNGPTNTQFRSSAPMKRTADNIKQEQAVQAKKKRFDVLTPDKDDEDCQVICMQPKNTDGLPQIESVQGATSESAESSIMHLSDSITLSVRNPPPKPASPKKSDAKAVANILATRGITVTPTAKPKEKQDSPSKSPSPLNLNGAVSIIPSAKQAKKPQESQLPTVDLTDDTPQTGPKSPTTQKVSPNFGLPFRCHLCPAQYPNSLGLAKHKQNYHKTSAGNIDMGIPLINLKQPGVLQKLGQLGIHNFIPLPTPQQDGTFAIPIINSRNPANVQAIGATNMLILGPVKAIPRPGNPSATSPNTPKQSPSQQK